MTDPRLWVAVDTARITAPSPLLGVGVATGSRAADGLGLTCCVGVSIAVTGAGLVALGRRTPKYTIVNTMTSTISARLAATSVGANIDLIEGHKPFLPMVALPTSRRSPGHLSEVALRTGVSRTDVPFAQQSVARIVPVPGCPGLGP